jgi:hypothetical protein
MSLPFHKSVTKTLLATAILCTPFIAAKCQAGTIAQEYKLSQETLTTVIAPSSGLTKASCKFFDKKGNRVLSQNVTVLTEYLEQGLYVVEVNAYNEHHNAIVSINCK